MPNFYKKAVIIKFMAYCINGMILRNISSVFCENYVLVEIFSRGFCTLILIKEMHGGGIVVNIHTTLPHWMSFNHILLKNHVSQNFIIGHFNFSAEQGILCLSPYV
jgi:hypothetical protein